MAVHVASVLLLFSPCWFAIPCTAAGDACRAAATEDRPGCPQRGASMIQTVARRGMHPSSMLQRSEATRKVEGMTTLQRTSLGSRMVLLGKQAAAAGIMARRATDKLTQDPANELDQLIFNFMASNSDSQDACPAKLLEAKHQMNQLHKHMYSVAYEINTTSAEVKHATQEITTLQLEWKTEQGECSDAQEKCDKEKAWYKKQWEILKWELIEMKQIANPGVQITASDMTYAAYSSKVQSEESSAWNKTSKWNMSTESNEEDSGQGPPPDYDGPGPKPNWWPSLLQVNADPTTTKSAAHESAKGVSALVMSTKAYARELQHCMLAFSQHRGDPAESSSSSSWGDSDKGGNSKFNATSTSDGHSAGTTNDLGGNGSRWRNSSGDNYTYNETWSKSFVNSTSNSGNISEACKKQLVAFETVYYKAYRQVVRLITEYEVLVNSTICEDAIDENCKEQDGEYSLKTNRETQKLGEMTEKMTKVKGEITVMSNQEKKLTQHIAILTETCHKLDETISDLDKVRDAIHIFDVCAGLGRPNFHIPIYTGQILVVEYDTTNKQDERVDADLNAFCNTISHNNLTARAAETAELMQQAIDGMPTSNVASAPLFGTCPHCRGDKDVEGGPQHLTGYARNCWDSNVALDGATMRSNCGHNSLKAVMCVVDRFDVVNGGSGPGSSTTITSGSSESSSESGSSENSSSSSSSGPGGTSESTEESSSSSR